MEKSRNAGWTEQICAVDKKGFDQRVGHLMEKLEIKTDRLMEKAPVEGQELENERITEEYRKLETEVQAWVDVVDFVVDEDMVLPKDAYQVLTKEETLIALALTEAKLGMVRDLLEEVYPVLSWQADEYLKAINEEVESILNEGKDSLTVESVSKNIEKRRGFSGKQKLVFSLALISSLIITACTTPVNAGTEAVDTPTPTPTMTSEVMATPTNFFEPTLMPTVAPTLEPTLMPTEAMTPTEQPRELLVGTLPETLEECRLNKLDGNNLAAEMERVNELENEMGFAWKPGEVTLGRNVFKTAVLSPFEKASIFYAHQRGSVEGRSPAKSCFSVDVEVSGDIHELIIVTVEVPLPQYPDRMINLHFAYDPALAAIRSSRLGAGGGSSLDETYRYMLGEEGVDIYFVTQIWGGDVNMNSFFEPSAGLRKLKTISDQGGYMDLFQELFLTNGAGTLSEEELNKKIDKLQSLAIPVGSFVASPDE